MLIHITTLYKSKCGIPNVILQSFSKHPIFDDDKLVKI